MVIRVKRVYEQKSREDGFRVLVDRIWPRGMPKERAGVDLWMREVAPSDALRKSFCHDPSRWEEFQKGYEAELKQKPEILQKIREFEKEKGTVTLVYSAKDEEHNQAVALCQILKKL